MRSSRLRQRAAVLAGCALLAVGGCGDQRNATSEPVSGSSTAGVPDTPTGERIRTFARLGSTRVEYTVVLPDGYSPRKRYPVLLVIPPGLQSRPQADALLDRLWQADPRRTGWVIVSPEAPAGQLFVGPGVSLVAPLLDEVARRYPPQSGRFHLAGVSNGGLGAFEAALATPRRFASLLVAPGYPPRDADLSRLRGIRITMFVGENDTDWRKPMERTFFALRRLRIPVKLGFSPGDAHVITNIPVGDYWDELDGPR
jgi:pimeloyl-ACP methyl ester carboxylesterase